MSHGSILIDKRATSSSVALDGEIAAVSDGELESYFRDRISREGSDLFVVFARFEHAMKWGGFRKNNAADAAWWAFADAMPNEFFEEMKAAQEASILFSAPPRRLECDGGDGVQWGPPLDPPETTRELFDRVKCVRNNLMHGDKKHNVDRDNKLARASLFVLNAAYQVASSDRKFSRFIGKLECGL